MPRSTCASPDVGWATAQYNREYLARDVAAFDVAHAGASVRYDVGSIVYVELHGDASRLLAPSVSTIFEPPLVVGGAAVGLDWSIER